MQSFKKATNYMTDSSADSLADIPHAFTFTIIEALTAHVFTKVA